MPFTGRMAMRALAMGAALLFAVSRPALADPTFPALTGRVVDDAAVIPPDVEARLDAKLAALETQSHRQLVVATIADLQGYDIADYGYQLGRHWGIGDKGRNDGALLIVAPRERKLRIDVGYGLEGVLTDGMSSLIINQTIVPRFKQDDMVGGIEAGVDAIIAQLQLPPEEAQRLAQEATQQAVQDDGSFFMLAFIIGSFLFMVFVIWIVSRVASGGRRYGGSGGGAPVVVWGGSDSGSSWSSSSDFSGGGGSFGGGGASGSW
jgi:uncharacterized protein